MFLSLSRSGRQIFWGVLHSVQCHIILQIYNYYMYVCMYVCIRRKILQITFKWQSLWICFFKIIFILVIVGVGECEKGVKDDDTFAARSPFHNIHDPLWSHCIGPASGTTVYSSSSTKYSSALLFCITIKRKSMVSCFWIWSVEKEQNYYCYYFREGCQI